MDEREVIADILVEILERCGVWMNQDERKLSLWGQLQASLELLVSNVDKIDASNLIAEGMPELLLDMEQGSQEIRGHLNLALEENDDISSALALCRDLIDRCWKVPMNPIGPLALALSTSVRTQRLDVQDALYEVDQLLSRLYEDVILGKSSQRDMTRRLKRLADHLGRRCIDPKVAPWKEAKDMAHSLLSGQSGTSQCLPLMNPLLPSHSQDQVQRGSDGDAMSDGSMSDPNNIIEAALAFANQRTISSNNNRCLLLVGPEGSGKSFCLDQIQQLAPSTVKGMYPQFQNSLFTSFVVGLLWAVQ